MMMLKNSLFGKPLRVVERLGYTARQYQTALEKHDQKYGGEKRLLQRHFETILRGSPVEKTNLKFFETFFRIIYLTLWLSLKIVTSTNS